MNLNNVEICIEDKTFDVRNSVGWDCIEEGHNWKILVFCGDYKPSPGLAICTKCALVEGGWVKDAVK